MTCFSAEEKLNWDNRTNQKVVGMHLCCFSVHGREAPLCFYSEVRLAAEIVGGTAFMYGAQ